MAALGKLFVTPAWLRLGSPVGEFGIAVAATGSALVLQLLVWPFIPASPHLFFYPAVFVAARLGGARAGYLATMLSTFAILIYFLPPEGFYVARSEDALDLGIFAAVSMGISAALGQLRDSIAREHELAQRATEAKESTDATWSMVAHDLRTPLSVISLGSTQLVAKDQLPPGTEKTLGLIKRSTVRASVLIDDALAAMRATEGKLPIEPAVCDTRELCARAVDAVALLAKGKGVTLDCRTETPRDVVCDPPRIEQVLTNLLGNAIKFTRKGGVVSLRVEEGLAGLDFYVRDTGAGIAEKELESIFLKFWTADHNGGSGTGLGLWIAGSILRAHGSRLAVESRLGEGTTFRFTLPAVAVNASGASSPE